MIYNTRVKTFAQSQQITIYSKSFVREKKEEQKKNENLRKGYKNAERTEQEENNCKNISIKQTKNRIYDIARSNTWEWFITLTFDRKQTDSSDYDTVVKELTRFLTNLQQWQCPNLKYLIVPELHADGEHYHFHGLLANCDGINFSYSGKNDRKSKKPIYNILNWKLGFTTATKVEDTQRVSSYITKYITKECVAVLKNKKRYYTSHNVNRPQVDYCLCTNDEFLELYGDSVSYCKSIDVPQAGVQVSYYELNN